jgi:hypothetical protein
MASVKIWLLAPLAEMVNVGGSVWHRALEEWQELLIM